ncbi:hypothetical protein D3C85_934640 [compost metagenome]
MRRDIGAERIGQGRAGAHQEIGTHVVPRRLVRQSDLLVLEVEALRHAQRHALEARVGVQPARGQRRGKLVGVGNAVPAAGVDVFLEGLRKTEIGQRGVEHRQRGLVAVRHVQVIQPRFQRLRGRLAEQRGIALEDQARVQRHDRHRARLRPRQTTRRTAVQAQRIHAIPFGLVLGVVDACLGNDEPARPDDRIGHRGIGLKAIAIRIPHR